MKNIPTDSLRTLVTVVEMGGFAKAGELLGLSQPAVSLQIKRLEEIIGKKLFKKQGQRQVLNHQGERLLPLAKQLLQTNDEIINTFSSQTLAGQVTLGIPNEFAVTLLPAIIGDFVALYPDVSLEVHSALSKQLQSSELKGKFDLILALVELDSKRGASAFMQDELLWVGSQPNPNEAVRLVCAPEGCVYRKRAIAALDNAGIEWKVVYSNADLTGLSAAIKEGLGVTVLARHSIPSELNQHVLQHVLPALGKIGLTLNASQAEDNDAVAKLAEFIRLRLA